MPLRPTAVVVGTSAVELVAGAELAYRRQLWIRNNGAAAIAIGPANTVTLANGWTIPPTTTLGPIDVSGEDPIWAISGTAGQDVDVLEVS